MSEVISEMRTTRRVLFWLFALMTLGLFVATVARAQRPAKAASSASFVGRWDLTLKGPDGEHPSWIEIKDKGGKLEALFTGRWGNARPLPKVEVAGDTVTFVSPKDEESTKEDLVFKGTLAGK